MRRTLHLVRTAVVLVAIVMLGAGVHFLHAFQVTRNSGVLLDKAAQAQKEADEAKKAGDQAKVSESLGEASRYLGRYLGFHPTDPDALCQYGLVAEEMAKTPYQKVRAFMVLEKAVRAAPDRADVRRRLANVAMDVGRTLDAKEHLDYLLHSFPDDPELELLRGRCWEADGDFFAAQQDYGNAIKHGPQQVDAYVRLSSSLCRRGKYESKTVKKKATPEEIRKLLNDMVDKSDIQHAAKAHLARARALREAVSFDVFDIANEKRDATDQAAKDVAAARAMAPEDVEVVLASAELNMEKNDLQGARQDLEQGLKAHPQELRLNLQMAALELRGGNASEALDHLHAARDALASAPSADDAWSVANLLIDAGKPDEAGEMITKLEAGGPSPAADYLEARLKMAKGEFGAAAALLEDHRKEMAASPELARQTDRLLGLCYERLGNPDQQLAAFRRAAEQDPSWLPGRFGEASALLANGKLDEALAEYRSLAGRSPEARLQAVRLLIIRNLRSPAASRDWKEADALLAAKDLPEDARKQMRQGAAYRLLEANLLAAEGRFKDAWDALDRAAAEGPKEPRYRLMQAELADIKGVESWKPPMTSQQVLEKAEVESGDSVALRLARAARFARLDKADAVKALAPLGENLDRIKVPADQMRLLTGVGDAYVRAGDVDAAAGMYKRAKELSNEDLAVRLRLFDVALQTKDEATLKEVVDEVRGIEGTDGPYWRFGEASLLVLKARRGEKVDLGEARALLVEAAKRRPDWSRPPLLEAEIDLMEGDPDAAAAKYRRAIDLGDLRPDVVRRAVQLLASRRRYDEANQVLQKLGGAFPGADLEGIAAELSLLNRDPMDRTTRLIETADKAAKGSKDFHDELWLGQLHEKMAQLHRAAGKDHETDAAAEHGKAVEAFRRARDLDRTAPETWTALVLCLAAGDESDKAAARTELEGAAKALPADKAAAVSASAYEAMGQRDKAEEFYAGLLKGNPEVANLRSAAEFYLRVGEGQKAAPLLQQIIHAPGQTSPEPARWARRTLALTLAASGDFQQSIEALKLLDQNLREETTPAAEDQRARALVLATQPGGRKESIRALEESFGRLRPTPDEEFLLARLYESEPSGWDRANDHYLAVVGAKGPPNPAYLAYYVQALLRHKDLNDAAAWLHGLVEAEPNSGRTLGAKARVLHAQAQAVGGEEAKKKDEQAAGLVQDYAQRTFAEKKNAAVLGEAASLLEELQQFDKAESFFRQYVKETEEKQPDNSLVLAAYLARRKRLGEALDVIEAAWPRCKVEAAARTAVATLRVSRDQDAQKFQQQNSQQFQRVERLLSDAITKNPMTTNLLVSMADLRDAEGRDDKAEGLYRDVLRANSRNPLALNNLAWLLAFQPGKGAEALDLAQQRIAITGPSAGVLDTRGMIFLKMGQAESAVQDFSDAVSQNSNAVYCFHLWEALQAAHNQADADNMFQKVYDLGGLQATAVHPLENADYQRWDADYARWKKDHQLQ